MESSSLSGRFITFEGIDGAGKSTHIEALAQRFQALGHTVVLTREPGGTPLAEQLRSLVLNQAMGDVTETLLMFAARRDHVEQVIQPALAQGHTVLCDRFSDATFAYQGGGRGVDWQLLQQLEQTVLGGLRPNLTVWFDLPAAVAAQRRAAARTPDRFEQLDLAFFERVRAAYARRAAESPERFVRLDAAQTVDQVGTALRLALESRGW
ncbi:MAG: dTMP kinase [Burkholderiales bacterium]